MRTICCKGGAQFGASCYNPHLLPFIWLHLSYFGLSRLISYVISTIMQASVQTQETPESPNSEPAPLCTTSSELLSSSLRMSGSLPQRASEACARITTTKKMASSSTQVFLNFPQGVEDNEKMACTTTWQFNVISTKNCSVFFSRAVLVVLCQLDVPCEDCHKGIKASRLTSGSTERYHACINHEFNLESD